MTAPEPQRLYRQIAQQLREWIRTQGFSPGERLPAERELAVQWGVSRSSLREAVIALEVEGAIEVRTGSGIYVKHLGKKKAANAGSTLNTPGGRPASASRRSASAKSATLFSLGDVCAVVMICSLSLSANVVSAPGWLDNSGVVLSKNRCRNSDLTNASMDDARRKTYHINYRAASHSQDI